MDILVNLPDFNIFWLKFIGSMERYMKAGAQLDDVKGALSIHFTESLKNVLLVMVCLDNTFGMCSIC